MKIFINPGHSVNPNEDPGACGNGLREADVVLKIGKRVENYLRAVGYDVKLFQYDGLGEICFDANTWKTDLFVSIHCNSAENPNAHGTETFSSGGAKSTRLAEKIQNQLVNSLPVMNRGVKIGERLYVLKNTDAPAVLVETAFINNPDDAKLLVEREDDFARAIARGVTDYFQNEKLLPDVVDTTKQASGALSLHFNASEFVCHCCGQGSVAPRLIELLEQLRTKAGKPIHINCGYRCPPHNAEVGGVPNSQHMFGTAADITIPEIGFERTRELVESIDFDGTGFYPPLNAGERGLFMWMFATAVSAVILNGGINMWNVFMLAATDPLGNSVAIGGNEITIAAFAEDGKRISRKIKLEETPPCLSVAIDDLLKLLADEQRNST